MATVYLSQPTKCPITLDMEAHLDGLWGGNDSLDATPEFSMDITGTGSAGFQSGACTCSIIMDLDNADAGNQGGIAASIFITYPDTRWATFYEDYTKRSQSRVVYPWGRGTEYMRIITFEEGDMYTATAGSTAKLSLGRTMPQPWADKDLTVRNAANSPRLQSINPIVQKDGAANIARLTYSAVDATGDLTIGYIETLRTNPRKDGVFGDIIETWGVAMTTSDYGIPVLGDYLDNVRTNVRKPICIDVQFDKTSQFGRVIIHSIWHAEESEFKPVIRTQQQAAGRYKAVPDWTN